MIEIIWLAIVAALVIFALAAKSFSVRRRRPATPAPGRAVFKVAAVGFEKVGKTVLLGSMFDTLRVPGPAGVALRAEPSIEGRLIELHRRTSDIHQPFPDATAKGNTTLWPFEVAVRLSGAVVAAAQFTYLDFAGEVLRDIYQDTPNPMGEHLFGEFLRADALIGMLDGALVKAYLDGRAGRSFYDDLNTLLSLLSRHPRPTSLILTKWDLMEDRYPFAVVVERLLQVPGFKNFVGSQSAHGGQCRLIPVSAVGQGFVRQDGENMVKQVGTLPRPTMTEVPVACVVADLVHQARTTKSESPARTGNLAGIVDWISFTVGPVGVKLRAPDDASRPAARTTAAAGSGLAGQAAQALLDFCAQKVHRLESTYPESNLSRLITMQGSQS